MFGWRRLYEAGKLGKPVVNPARLLPVSVADQPETVLPAKAENAADCRTGGGTIHLEMRKVRVRIAGRVDPELLRLVLGALQG